jgi:hypothetical protein
LLRVARAGAFAGLAFAGTVFFAGGFAAGAFFAALGAPFAGGFGVGFGAGFAGVFLVGFFVAMVPVEKASPGGASSATWTNRLRVRRPAGIS